MEIIEEQYNLVDKSKWDRGEWDSEPDIVKLIDERYYPYLIRRGHDSMGHLCGYAGVPESSPLWGKHYDSVQNFEVELTFAGTMWEMSPLIWWLGWDHAHHMDLVPGMTQYKLGTSSTYKNIQYVISEIETISIQLKVIEKMYVASEIINLR